MTALLAAHLNATSTPFRALKPFCSGERTDALLLQALQDGRFPIEQVNPFYFPKPVSPWTAAKQAGQSISLEEILAFLREQARPGELLLIEGAGGLLSPLGEKFNATDLIVPLEAEVILVAANRLGVLNHILLTMEALRRRTMQKVKIALIDPDSDTLAVRSNEGDLRALLPDIQICRIPFLSSYSPDAGFIREAAEALHSTLEDLLQ